MTTPLPEPAIHAPFLKEVRTVWMGDYYTEAQLKDYGSAEYKQAIEDAANCYSPDDSATDWMDKIRKLGETPLNLVIQVVQKLQEKL